mmetsp:Transcript_35617/g.65232  ORF Transcript_35617/g.65232 Transcript_35617/m.65232 type:complete len:225 (-) Transcript_35617:77-751(-)
MIGSRFVELCISSLLLTCWSYVADGKDVPLVIFGERKHRFRYMDDDIVAGHSRVNGQNAIAQPDKRGWVKLEGNIGDRPHQQGTPGWLRMTSEDFAPRGNIFSDITSCKSISLLVYQATPFHGSFHLEFGETHADAASLFAFGWIASFQAPKEKPEVVKVPLDRFSACWNDDTFVHTKSCADARECCVPVELLKDVQVLTLWAAGASGRVHLRVHSINGTDCDP